DHDGARPTRPLGRAPVLHRGQPEALPKHLEQRLLVLDVERGGLVVQGERDRPHREVTLAPREVGVDPLHASGSRPRRRYRGSATGPRWPSFSGLLTARIVWIWSSAMSSDTTNKIRSSTSKNNAPGCPLISAWRQRTPADR